MDDPAGTEAERSSSPRPVGWVRRWLSNREVDYEDRQRVSDQLFLQSDPDRISRFVLLMALSVTIATYGLLIDSTAVVIGAMLLAPLMTPVLGLAAALSMNWPSRMVTSGALVLGGAAGAVGLAWLITELTPIALTPLPGEVLSRTRPSTADLAIALAAGAAGGVALIREDVSTALPGVAIAVALLPPLGVVGITLGAREPSLAFEALLLFTANVVAIILASALVFLVGGYVPHAQLVRSRAQVLTYLVLLIALVGLIAVPLRLTLDRLLEESQLTAAVESDVATWLGPDTEIEVTAVDAAEGSIRLDLVGPEPPPPTDDLVDLVEPNVGEGVSVEVRWIQETVSESSTAGD